MKVQIIQTAKKSNSHIWKEIEPLDKGSQEATVLNIGKRCRDSKFLGFGGAFTESSAWVWSKLEKREQTAFLESYFDAEKGLAYRYGRTHMNSCDFSLDNYAAVTVPGDTKLWSFACEREKQYLWPFIQEAYHVAQRTVPLLLSPWSPPAWMKTNQSMNNGGKLLPEYRTAWAEYFVRYIQEMQKQNLSVFGVTVQNEPEATQTWDSCRYTAEEEAVFIRDYLGPAFEAHAMQNLGIYFWDHNRDECYNRAKTVLSDPKTRAFIKGLAIHWYSGDQFDLVEKTKAEYPELEMIFSEGCIEGGVKLGQWDRGEIYAHNIIGDLNAGVVLWLDWNMLLDQQGGPNHVGNYCDAPVVANLDAKSLHYQTSYAYIGHFSRYIRPDAVCLFNSIDKNTQSLEALVFQNPDETYVCVVLNRSSEDTVLSLAGDFMKTKPIVAVPQHSITTILLNH